MSSKTPKVYAAKGTRDFLPVQMIIRNKILNTVKTVFEKYGYEPLETPSIERIETLTGKYGEEGDQLIFKILKRGTGVDKAGIESEEYKITDYKDIIDLGLRYDLTVPLCRVVAMYRNSIVFPFKRYQIQPVWRADKPQKGRYREFYQCDIDVIGSSSMVTDAEIITVMYDVLKELGFEQFTIKINNRKILNALLDYCTIERSHSFSILSTIDKLDKIGKEGVIKELRYKNVPDNTIDSLFKIIMFEGDNEKKLNEVDSYLNNSIPGKEGIGELQEIFKDLCSAGIDERYYTLDLSLSRGLEYYTGPIFEAVVEKPKIGSLAGGGRYDKLIGMFLNEDIPATGTSFGIERIADVMTELNMIPKAKTISQVLVTIFDKSLTPDSMRVAAVLRKSGINAELFPEPVKLSKQLSYANKKGIPFVCITGPEEKEKNIINVKNMETGNEYKVEQDKITDFFYDMKRP